MPSFDVVSEVDMHEVTNAVDQANKEVGTRFDFRGSNARYERVESVVNMRAESEFQLQQMLDILQTKLTRRNVDISCLDVAEAEVSATQARQSVTIRQGIDTELARSLVKLVKGTKLKVQASIQGEQIRVTGKKRDVLQQVITELRSAQVELPLQYKNFRD